MYARQTAKNATVTTMKTRSSMESPRAGVVARAVPQPTRAASRAPRDAGPAKCGTTGRQSLQNAPAAPLGACWSASLLPARLVMDDLFGDSALRRCPTPPPTDRAPRTSSSSSRKGKRGRLKLYIGFAAGVGKTYRMLEEAHALRERGVDVVIGFVETHGRAETAALVDGLEVVPRRHGRVPRRHDRGDEPRTPS